MEVNLAEISVGDSANVNVMQANLNSITLKDLKTGDTYIVPTEQVEGTSLVKTGVNGLIYRVRPYAYVFSK